MNTEYNVYKTTNYDKFHLIDSNRSVSDSNVSRLAKSFAKQYLISPILVNEEFEVIDGQNRLATAKKLGLPVYYFIVVGYGSKQMKRLNINKIKWSLEDYFKSYLAEDREEYVRLKMHMVKNSINFLTAITFLAGYDNNPRFNEVFTDGNLKFDDPEAFDRISSMYNDFKPYISAANKKAFTRAFMTVIKHKNYDQETMVGKLALLRFPIGSYTKESDYINNIQQIYNYKNTKKIHFEL